MDNIIEFFRIEKSLLYQELLIAELMHKDLYQNYKVKPKEKIKTKTKVCKFNKDIYLSPSEKLEQKTFIFKCETNKKVKLITYNLEYDSFFEIALPVKSKTDLTFKTNSEDLKRRVESFSSKDVLIFQFLNQKELKILTENKETIQIQLEIKIFNLEDIGIFKRFNDKYKDLPLYNIKIKRKEFCDLLVSFEALYARMYWPTYNIRIMYMTLNENNNLLETNYINHISVNKNISKNILLSNLENKSKNVKKNIDILNQNRIVNSSNIQKMNFSANLPEHLAKCLLSITNTNNWVFNKKEDNEYFDLYVFNNDADDIIIELNNRKLFINSKAFDIINTSDINEQASYTAKSFVINKAFLKNELKKIIDICQKSNIQDILRFNISTKLSGEKVLSCQIENEEGVNLPQHEINIKYLEFKDNNALLGAKNQNNNIYLRGIYILKAIESLQGKNIRFYFPNSQETMFVQLENSEKLNDLTSYRLIATMEKQ